MKRVTHARLSILATLAALTACSGGGGTTGGVKTSGDFVVLQTEPSDNGTLYLNDAIRIDFSNPVDLDSVDRSTFSFEVRDQLGNTVAEPVAGEFLPGTSPGDAEEGRRLLFVPRLPTNDLYTNGGFRPGRSYTVQLVGGNRASGTILRDKSGKGLAQPRTFVFVTADGTSPSQLFRNTAPGGPRRTGLEITPQPDATGVVLNKLGQPPVEIRLRFDQPLNPNSANVPVAVVTDPATRNSASRGRVFLEYDDFVYGDNEWIPADIDLEENELDGSTLTIRPLGVLPNNATIRVIVERTLEDISGESNVANAAYERIFGTFKTKRAYEQQFDGLVDDFTSGAQVDFTAAFGEPVAEVGPGYLKAGFAFEGTTTGAEFEPNVPETILNTNFTQVQPKNGPPINVSGGVFNFKSVKIPANRTVRGQGSNPMIWLCAGSFEVDGVLTVDGGDGAQIMTAANANVPKAGGVGVCGGGDGGQGSPSAVARDLSGGNGNGPLQVVGQGGLGGALSCTAGCNRGAGGGGGSLATQGDPNYKTKIVQAGAANPYPIFQQQTGQGGNGCLGIGGAVTRSLQGGAPGPIVFADARNDNNYWGVAIRYDRRERVVGELAIPVGGAGGGGGGDLSYNASCNITDVNFQSDSSGGGGGGGAGVLVVKALGPIIIRDTGRVSANGGNGGGGEQSASCSRGGGGGGGAGGMVVLMSADSIEIHAKGSANKFLYASPDHNYEYAVSAEGGICKTSTFLAPQILSKYPTNNVAVPASYGVSYDSAPLGGFGGMGIVQLMAPPGDGTDGTNTVLDDNIKMFRSGAQQTGLAKQQLLAWRGFPNQIGQGLNDAGGVITIGDNEGEIRPSPTLLPVPFGAKSRLQSKWIDTGASARRGLLADDNRPRGIIELNGALRGPTYEFAGLNDDPDVPVPNIARGYADYVVSQNEARVVYPTAVPATAILKLESNATYLGRSAYRVELQQPVLGAVVDRYTQYVAELLTPADEVFPFRIYSHNAKDLFLAAEGTLPADADRLRVVAKFFRVETGGTEGLGPTYLGTGGQRRPVANVRIGFAFHTDPSSTTAARLPATPGTFLYDITSPAVQEQIRTLGGPNRGPSFVQWDILFDGAFELVTTDDPPILSPDLPRPEIHYLRLPFRF